MRNVAQGLGHGQKQAKCFKIWSSDLAYQDGFYSVEIHSGWMDGWMDVCMDGWMDGQIDNIFAAGSIS
jgi:hypothetical protein